MTCERRHRVHRQLDAGERRKVIKQHRDRRRVRHRRVVGDLQTGSSNLTLADTNEEAANSQALSTRQSIAVSALSLANQSQQSVLQLLR